MASSVYEWDHRINNPVYMTIDTGINFFFDYTDRNEIPLHTRILSLDFVRQHLYDERLKISNKLPRLDNYTFHNMR